VGNPIGPANTAKQIVVTTADGCSAFIDRPAIGGFNTTGFFTATIKPASVAIPISTDHQHAITSAVDSQGTPPIYQVKPTLNML
jgi:hypothetical protein